MTVHHLKILPEYFRDIRKGIKPFEVRKNDRNYQVGDTLILNEYNPHNQIMTGAWTAQQVIYKLDNPSYVKEGFVILGIKEIIV
jgi:ASC-1-like (ASCH) protein